MKNYYIERYITLYNKNKLIETQKADRWQVASESAGLAFLQARTPKAIENKNGFSVYESFVMTIKDEEFHYKRLINEMTPQGIIKNV